MNYKCICAHQRSLYGVGVSQAYEKQKEYQQYGLCAGWRLLYPGSEAAP